MTFRYGPPTVKEMLWVMELTQGEVTELRKLEVGIALVKGRFPDEDIDNLPFSDLIPKIKEVSDEMSQYGNGGIPDAFKDWK